MFQLAFPGGCSRDTLPPTATHSGPAQCPELIPQVSQPAPGKDDAGRIWKCSFPDSAGKHLPLSSSPQWLSLMDALSWFHEILFSRAWGETPGGRGVGPGTALTNTSKPKSKCKDFFFFFYLPQSKFQTDLSGLLLWLHNFHFQHLGYKPRRQQRNIYLKEPCFELKDYTHELTKLLNFVKMTGHKEKHKVYIKVSLTLFKNIAALIKMMENWQIRSEVKPAGRKLRKITLNCDNNT